MRASYLLLPLFLLTGCPSDNNSTTEDAQHAHSAIETKYDKTSSMLGADNVQDALDELATRREGEPPLASRLELVVKTFKNNGKDFQYDSADCPDKDHDLALSGSCGRLPFTTISSTELAQAAFACAMHQPPGTTEDLEVRVLCLRNAR